MSLAQLIDPGPLFGRPLGLTSTEHSGRLLGISSNYVIRQAEIFKHAKENSIALEAYIKQITMSQKQFDYLYIINYATKVCIVLFFQK